MKDRPNYAFSNHRGTWTKGQYTIRNSPTFGFVKGDIITAILDTNNATISLEKDQRKHVIYKGIEIGDDIQYKMAVILYSKGDSISVLDFVLESTS